jgi:hypothetical protein
MDISFDNTDEESENAEKSKLLEDNNFERKYILKDNDDGFTLVGAKRQRKIQQIKMTVKKKNKNFFSSLSDNDDDDDIEHMQTENTSKTDKQASNMETDIETPTQDDSGYSSDDTNQLIAKLTDDTKKMTKTIDTLQAPSGTTENKNKNSYTIGEPEANSSSKNNVHTIPQSQLKTTWIPIRIHWQDTKINLKSSTVWPTIDKENIADNTPIENHFIIEKLRDFHGMAKYYDDSCSISAGATRDILSDDYFTQVWTINRVKNRFAYFIDRRKTVMLTLYLNLGNANNLDHFKNRMMKDLKNFGIYVSEHRDGMQDLETVAIGWIQGLHPDVCDLDEKEHELNSLLRKKIIAEKEKVLSWCKKQTEIFLQNWQCENIPYIRVYQVKPFFAPHKNQKFITRAVGIRGQKRYGRLVRKLLAEIDIEQHKGRVSFVPYDMLSAGREMSEQYGKIVALQQKVLRDNSFQTIFGITKTMFAQIEQKILQIPGITSIHKTRQSISQGKYRLLTQTDLPQARLEKIDDILRNINFDPTNNPLNEPPHRQKRSNEKISDPIRNAWKQQTLGVQQMTPPSLNAWRKPPLIHNLDTKQFPAMPKTMPKLASSISKSMITSDDKSVTTSATVSFESDEMILLKETVSSLKKRLKQLEANDKKLAENVRTNNSKIKQLNQLIESHKSDTTTLTSNISDLDKNFDKLSNMQIENLHRFDNHESRLAITENKMNSLEISHSRLEQHLTIGFATNNQVSQHLESNVQQLRSDFQTSFEALSKLVLQQQSPVQEIFSPSKRAHESLSDITSSQGTPSRTKKQATSNTPPRMQAKASTLKPAQDQFETPALTPTLTTAESLSQGTSQSTSDLLDDDPVTQL